MSDELAPSSGAPSTAASSAGSVDSAAPASVATADPSTGSVAPVTHQSDEFGPVPYARFAEVNTKAKEAAAWREKYGWAEQFQTDPYTFVDSWMDQLAEHPEHKSKILAKAARMLQSRRGQQPTQATEEPQADIPVMDGNGNVVNQTYSATQLRKWQEWNYGQQQSALAERLAPLEQTHKELQKAREKAQLEAQATQQSTERLTTLRQDPYFKEHEPKVKAALLAHPEWGDDVQTAYAYVLTTEVIPTLKKTEQTTVLAHLKTQAAGSTVSPSNQTATQKPKFIGKDGRPNFGKAYEYFLAHPEEEAEVANR